ncbi:hypothetical protein F5146DRAFT_162047 [Armillaria mellea]|nr:hypothetical protein F5146DRAFT_162047 [Armillaria mellea]
MTLLPPRLSCGFVRPGDKRRRGRLMGALSHSAMSHWQPEPDFAPFAFTDIESMSPSRAPSPERGDAPRQRRRGAKAVAKNDSTSAKDTLKLKLELNLAVDITIKARVHGDVTLSLLS